jgi:hypothetical protein
VLIAGLATALVVPLGFVAAVTDDPV